MPIQIVEFSGGRGGEKLRLGGAKMRLLKPDSHMHTLERRWSRLTSLHMEDSTLWKCGLDTGLPGHKVKLHLTNLFPYHGVIFIVGVVGIPQLP